MTGEHVIWNGIDAMYEHIRRTSEALIIAVGIMTGVIATNEQVTLESAQRGEQ